MSCPYDFGRHHSLRCLWLNLAPPGPRSLGGLPTPGCPTCLHKYLVLLLQTPLLHLAPSALLRLPHAPLALSQHGEGVDPPLLLQPHELFGQKVKHVCQHPSFQVTQMVFNDRHLKNNTGFKDELRPERWL